MAHSRSLAPTAPLEATPPPCPTPATIALVGGGVSGLSAARALVDAGMSVTVFDKGRSPGGRVATRRHDGLAFDHGAQYLTARNPRFVQEVESWAEDDVVRPWRGRVVELGPHGERPREEHTPRWVGLGGMSAVSRRLAEGLDVRSRVRIEAVEQQAQGWYLSADDGSTYGPFDALVVALPPAQAAPLLAASPALLARARAASMSACVAIMVAFETPYTLAWDGAVVRGGPLAWVARERSKPGRRVVDTWVLHGAPEWSDEHLEQDDDMLAQSLLAAFSTRAGRPLPAVSTQVVHRWRYALAAPALPEPCLFDEALGLGACGDWCGGSSVEGAWLSGRALARRLLATRGRLSGSSAGRRAP